MVAVTTRAGKGTPITATEHDNNLSYILSFHKGATEPSTTYSCMLWADTTASVIKQRNVADDAWVTLGAVDSVFAFVPIKDEDSMASASASHLSTQSSIKAYVDAQIGGENTLAEDDDVNITTPGDAALLLYDTGTSTWRDAALSGDATISDTGVITIEAGAIDIAHLSATGTPGTDFLRGDNTWATPTDTNTTYSVQDGELSEINFTSADHTKLNAIEAGADVTDATNVTAAGALMDSELAGIAAIKATTGTFLTADQTKLDGIETSATADQTGAEIKTAYEAEANAYTDTKNTKLAGIETSATADQTAGEILTLIEDGIDSVHYVDASIDNVHLADDAVDSDELASGAVDIAHLSATGTPGTNFLRGDNTWAAVDALPSQSGNAGKYLTTNATTASWATLDTDANTTTKGLYEHEHTIDANYSIASGSNALSAGPITIDTGNSVTVPTGSTWVIV